jgi:hypothetical protein
MHTYLQAPGGKRKSQRAPSAYTGVEPASGHTGLDATKEQRSFDDKGMASNFSFIEATKRSVFVNF